MFYSSFNSNPLSYTGSLLEVGEMGGGEGFYNLMTKFSLLMGLCLRAVTFASVSPLSWLFPQPLQ